MKICPKCKTEHQDEKKFCKTCRVKLLPVNENVIKSSSNSMAEKKEYNVNIENQNHIQDVPANISEQAAYRTAKNSKTFVIAGGAVIAIAGIIIFLSSVTGNNSIPGQTADYSEINNEKQTLNPEENSLSEYSIDYEAIVSDTNGWTLSRKYIFDEYGNPRNEYISGFLAKLESPEGEGLPVPRSEFEALLERPEARIIYANRLIRYATPVSDAIQKKEHEDYTKIFLREKRVRQGIKFLHEHEAVLSQAEIKFNIPRKDLVAILMWESGLGEFTGDYQIFNIFLEQLAFMDYAREYAVRQLINSNLANPLDDNSKKQKEANRLEKRRKDAASNLAVLLRLCKQNQQDPLLQKGSWGGAIGFVQFMPYNLKYAVDGDNDGLIHLNSFNDAIFSVANYLVERGNYGSSERSREQAILTYNRSDEYVSGVIAYAEAIWTRYSSGE